MYTSRSGFTLLEMAIVIVVISLLLSSFLAPIATEIDVQRVQWTQQQLEDIKKALLGFSAIYKRLPCPAPDAGGREQVIFQTTNNPPIDPTTLPLRFTTTSRPQACQVAGEGFLPWVTLGVGRYDAWGRAFRYRVAQQFPTVANPTRVNVMLSTPSNLVVKDAMGTIQLTHGTNTHVAAVILSYGKNAVGDDDNGDFDATYVMDTKLRYLVPGNPPGLDDILTWLSTNTLAYYLVSTKEWPKAWPSE